MRTLILQHFERVPEYYDETPELVLRSRANIAEYAGQIGAEYRFLGGEPFRPGLRAQCQKVCIINEEYDEYDSVAILDTDKFVTTTCVENVFEAPGVAFFSDIHRYRLLPAFCREFPQWADPATPIWSGAIYVMDRELRQTLRAQIDAEMERMFAAVSPRPYVDEGIIHCLCAKAGVKPLSLDLKWDYSSYLPNPERANMIHMRHRPKSRIENYQALVARGIINGEVF